ncbi:MAG: hypothetical protein RR092_01265 [Oscillospiraceae bacterium]
MEDLKTLPPRLLSLLDAKDCRKLLETPSGVADCPSLFCPQGGTLLLSLEREHTAAGRCLVQGIWFDTPVTLWLCQGDTTLRLTAAVHRCHIVGTVFSQMLRRAQGRGIASAWELHLLRWEETTATPPAPCPPEPVVIEEGPLRPL